jgi:hypothetical protein
MSENSRIQQDDRVWRNSNLICALDDGERHLGHVLKVGRHWYAFDATHFNEESNGFRTLGSFASLSAAKDAVGQSARAGHAMSASAASYSDQLNF